MRMLLIILNLWLRIILVKMSYILTVDRGAAYVTLQIQHAMIYSKSIEQEERVTSMNIKLG